MISPNILSAYLRPGSIIFDIGAHHGRVSKVYHDLGYKVHAFEGSSSNSVIFKERCGDLDNVTLHEVALNDHEGVTKTRFNDCNGSEHPEIEVHYVEFDDYFLKNELPNPDFVKLDIEGMESVACKKMSHLIEKVRPIFQIEIHDDKSFNKYKYSDYPSFVSVEEGGFDFKKFLDEGYNSYLFKYGLLKSADNYHKHAQYLFVPKEKDLKNVALRRTFLGFKDYYMYKYRTSTGSI